MAILEKLEPMGRLPIRLPPLPLWKWIFAVLILLSIPVAVLVQQTISTFRASADLLRTETAGEVEKLASRMVVEMKNSLQLKAVLEEYYEKMRAAASNKYLLQSFVALNKTPVNLGAYFALQLAERSFEAECKRLEKRLRRLIPGIRLLQWGPDLQLLSESDAVTPKWAYQKLHESIKKRLQRETSDALGSRPYLENLELLQRFFGFDAPLAQFLKFGGELIEFTDPTGHKYSLYWEHARIYGFLPDKESVGGFLAIIDLERLPDAYGLELLIKRKSHELKDSEITVGWINENRSDKFSLPYPFPQQRIKDWTDWVKRLPDGQYERGNLSVAKRRAEGGLVLVVGKGIGEIAGKFSRNVFLLLFFIAVCLAVPCFVVVFFRRNDGMAISIRWQIFSLFLFSLILPCAAIFLLGSELLSDRQKSYENEAYRVLETIKKDFEKNTVYAFRHLESISEELSRKLMSLDFDSRGRFSSSESARSLINAYGNKVHFAHFYLFNAAGDLVLSESGDSNNTREGNGLQPLVQSLAKIKLRFSGNLRSTGKMGEVSMMDLLVETTGGLNQDDVRNILNNRSNRAFEMKFSGRRTCFFVGEYFPKSRPDEAHIIVFLIRDVDFEKMFVRLMIEKFSENDRLSSQIQLFFGRNRSEGDEYFYNSPQKNPWFHFTGLNADVTRLGRLSEPTRYDAVTVKETVRLSAGERKCLFYSFRPSCLDMVSLVALYDYSIIDSELQRLKLFIFISFLVSFIVVFVLARIMARSLIEPVTLLKQGVLQVEAGNYRTHLILPGQDELVALAEAFNHMSSGLDERDRMTRYLSKSAVNAVVSGEDGVMGGKRVPATVLFSDIRSFTTISESNDPETVVGLLNDYFAVMNRVVEENGGDIDKFIGDAIMAQFISVDKSPAEMALLSVKCALQMMKALAQFNQQRADRGLFPIKIGVGINSGEVIAGNICSPGRMDRTVIGDTVNVASRLEGMSKLGRHTCIIISRTTLELLGERVVVEQLAETAVKGKTTAVEMFEVVSLNY